MFIVKSFQEIVARMISWITTHTTRLTDFNEGSTNRTILESVAWVIKEIVLDFFLAFRNELKNFIYDAFAFSPKDAEKAIATVRFTADEAPVADIIIPLNTTVETEDGVGFVTTEEGVLLAGNTTTADIPVIAVVAGSSGNVRVATITSIVTAISGISTVTNAIPATGGTDAESEDEQRDRFKRHTTNLARCTVVGIESGAESVTGVKYAGLLETPTPGLLQLYIDDGSGGASPALIDDVEFVIEGNGTPEYPGYRGAGTVIEYYAVNRIDILVTQTVYVRRGADVAGVKAAIELAQTNYVNTRRIGEDVIQKKLQDMAFSVKEVIDINMTVPAANVVVGKDSVAKMSTFTTTIVEIDIP